MAEYGLPLSAAQDAKRAAKGYAECAGKAAAALQAMLGRAGAHKARVEALIAQVAVLCTHIRAMADRHGSSDADIVQTFKSTVNAAGGRGAAGIPAAQVATPDAAVDLKDRFAEFVSHMGRADRWGRPLARAGDDYHRLWIRMVNDSVELFHALDRVGLASANTRAKTRAETRADAQAESRPDAQAETRAETRADAQAETRADAQAETRAEPKAGRKA